MFHKVQCWSRVHPHAQALILTLACRAGATPSAAPLPASPQGCPVLALTVHIQSRAAPTVDERARHGDHARVRLTPSLRSQLMAILDSVASLVKEKPALFDAGVGVSPDGASNSGYGLDVAGMAGSWQPLRVTLSRGRRELGLQGSAMKLQW
jgi:hypothetical protein